VSAKGFSSPPFASKAGSLVLSHHHVSPSSPTLSPSTLRSALAFAEAIIPGSARTPGADEATIARTEQVLRGFGDGALRGWTTLLVALDQAARLTTGRPFHALSRKRQEEVLMRWEKNPLLRHPLNSLAHTFKAAHFDSRRTYTELGGHIRTLNEAPAPRWEAQIKSAASFTGERDIECDVVVIGTGAGGAVVGRELADRGLAVVFIEEGKRLQPRDYVGSLIQAQTSNYRNVPVLGGPPILVLMGKLVGGSSAVNGGTCVRPPVHVHREWCEELDAEDLSVERMDPYFRRVEEMLSVSEPERRYIGPIADVFDRGARAFGWRVGPVPRNAVGCQGEGFCDFGCASGARRSVDIAYLPGALERGALVLSDLSARRVIVEGGRAVGVEAYGADHRRFRVRGRAVVVAGGAVPTPLLLLRQGLANRSGQVGKNLSLHPSVGLAAQFDELIEPQRYIPQGYMLTEFLRDGIFILAAQPDVNVAHVFMPFTGDRLMHAIDALPHLATFGALIRDKTRGRVWFDVGGHPAVTYNLGREDASLLHRALIHTAELCWEAGARRVYTGLLGAEPLESRADLARFSRRTIDPSELALISYHPLGTCRMGRDGRTSVIDLDHEAHDVPGLFVVDGSSVPGPPGVNPQLVIMAMATRAAERIAAKL
jgi:choline dehydrogenase-like flavoprotein